MYFLSDGGPQLSRQNKIHLQQNKINSRHNKENELVSGWSAVGRRLVSDWSAVVIGISNGMSCNSNTPLAQKTAIFRAHDVLLRAWFGS